jgi:NAD(P)-dependent dehydrogenase (short-subunit alcohol dehydrogenase family)
MADELKGKVAIITGGARGIGGATAELFVEEGARVVIADVEVEAGEALARRLGANARFKRTDVSKRDEVQALVDHAIAEFGDLDVMFNNAGISGAYHNRFLDDPLDDIDKVLAVNLAGVMWGSQAAARHMAKQRKGSIINTASIAGIDASYAITAYRASKAGVINFTKSIAIDLGEYGIRVNALCPGHILTAMSGFSAPGLPPEKAQEMEAAMMETWMVNQPLARHGEGRDCAQAALYFASDRSLQVTGQALAVDGGITAGDPINLHALLMQTRARFVG